MTTDRSLTPEAEALLDAAPHAFGYFERYDDYARFFEKLRHDLAAIEAAATAAERERIAAALPEAIKDAMNGADYDAPWLEQVAAILAHSAIRAIVAPEDEPS